MSKYLHSRWMWKIGALIGATIISGWAMAQPPVLEEIIVTAQKRTESLQDVSVSVNVMTGEKLSEAGINKLEDLQAYVPNLTMSETGIGTNIYMRGIGSGINQGFEQSVGMYVDGVYYGRSQLSRAPFLDLERVEVLRGPQNILYGKNSVAGAMSLITADPTDEFSGSVGIFFEPEFNDQVADLVLSGPLTDNLSARLAHRTRSHDGYIDTGAIGSGPGREESTTRLTLQWQASDDLEATLKYTRGTFDVTGRQIEIIGDAPSLNPALGGANWSQFLFSLNPLHASTGAAPTAGSVLNTDLDFQRSSNGDYSKNETDNFSLNFDYLVGGYTLTSTTGYLTYEYDERCDCDFTSADIFSVDSQEQFEQLSQEFRITSPGGQNIDWIAGVYLHSSELDFNDAFGTTPTSAIGNVLDSILPAAFGAAYAPLAGQQLVNISVPRTFEQDTDLWSAFVQATWNATDSTRLTLGGRYSSEEKTGSRVLTVEDANGDEIPYNDLFVPGTDMGIDYMLGSILKVARHDLSGAREETKFAPSITIEQDLNDDMMAYVNWSRGFKSGGYDTRSNAPANLTSVTNPFNSALSYTVDAGSFEYQPEKNTTTELGLKSRLLGGAMELNVAAFNTEFEDLQVSIYDGVLGFNVGNAAKATSKGVELEGRFAVNDILTLSGSVAWLDFEFEEFLNGQSTQSERIVSPGNSDYKGKTNQYVADVSGALSADMAIPFGSDLEFRTTLDLVFTTDYNPSQNLDATVQQDGYNKINLRFALEDFDAGWEVAIVAKNLTDEEVVTYANDTPLAANLTQSVGHYAFIESPRTIALQGTYRF
jgi:iron complex outermembrane receptor protein